MIKYFNQDKLARAKKKLGENATEKEIFEQYLLLGGKYEMMPEETIGETTGETIIAEPKKRGRRKKYEQ